MDSGKHTAYLPISTPSVSSVFQPQITQAAQEGLGSSEYITATPLVREHR